MVASLSITSRWLTPRELSAGDVIAEARPLASFIIAVVAFLLLKSLLSPSTGRDISFAYVAANLSGYLSYIFSPLLYPGDLTKLLPLHERIVYWGGSFALIAFVAFHAVKFRSLSGVVVVAALICAVLLAPDPFNLLGKELAIPPRTMVPIVFFQVGATMKLLHLMPPTLRPSLLLASVVFVTASAANQVKLYGIAVAQNAVDKSYVDSITSAIKATYALSDQPKLAVKSDWTSSPQISETIYMDFGVSAFATPWSNAAIFRLQSDVPFVSAPLPKTACARPPTTQWYIEKIEDTIVVCMR
jgi:hypothetical protein